MFNNFDEIRDDRITIRVPKKIKTELKKIARSRRLTMSKIVIKALEESQLFRKENQHGRQPRPTTTSDTRRT